MANEHADIDSASQGRRLWPWWIATVSLTITLGFIAGKLLVYLGPSNVPDITAIAPEPDAARTVLRGMEDPEGNGVIVQLQEPWLARAHGRKLASSYLKDMSLDPNRYELLELRVANNGKQPIQLSEAPGMLELASKSGVAVRSEPLPASASSEIGRIRLVQRRPSGELAPGMTRQCWVLLPAPLDLPSVTGGTYSGIEGKKLELAPIATN